MVLKEFSIQPLLFQQEAAQLLFVDAQTLPSFDVDRVSFLVARIDQNFSQEEEGVFCMAVFTAFRTDDILS